MELEKQMLSHIIYSTKHLGSNSDCFNWRSNLVYIGLFRHLVCGYIDWLDVSFQE